MLIQQRKPVALLARAKFKPFDFLNFFWGGLGAACAGQRWAKPREFYVSLYYIIIYIIY